LLAEAANAGMELEPLGGEAIQTLVANVLRTPRTIAERAKDYLQ
jgi:hypothetical protein